MKRIDPDLYLVKVTRRQAELVRSGLTLLRSLAPADGLAELDEALALFTQAQPVEALPCPHSYSRDLDGEIRCSRCHLPWTLTDDRPPAHRQEATHP